MNSTMAPDDSMENHEKNMKRCKSAKFFFGVHPK